MENRTFSNIADINGLKGIMKARFVRYMTDRWKEEEKIMCTSGYASEWCDRFKKGCEYGASDSIGQAILDIIDDQEFEQKGECLTMGDLMNGLSQCIGTENYHKNFTGIVYTDGIKEMAEMIGGYWIIDLIGSVQRNDKVFGLHLQVWTLTIKDSKAVIVCREDTNSPIVYKQKIEYTDFPEGEITFFVQRNILFLPSEY